MADENLQPVFQIQRIYLKDLSLEQPNSPAIFLEQEAPTIEVSLDVGAEGIADGIYESTVTITVTAKVKDKVAFLVEGKQAGIFEARNIPAEQMDPLLGIGCPNIIYPYLRCEHRRRDHPCRFPAGPPGRDQLRSVLPAAPPGAGRAGCRSRHAGW